MKITGKGTCSLEADQAGPVAPLVTNQGQGRLWTSVTKYTAQRTGVVVGKHNAEDGSRLVMLKSRTRGVQPIRTWQPGIVVCGRWAIHQRRKTWQTKLPDG